MQFLAPKVVPLPEPAAAGLLGTESAAVDVLFTGLGATGRTEAAPSQEPGTAAAVAARVLGRDASESGATAADGVEHCTEPPLGTVALGVTTPGVVPATEHDVRKVCCAGLKKKDELGLCAMPDWGEPSCSPFAVAMLLWLGCLTADGCPLEPCVLVAFASASTTWTAACRCSSRGATRRDAASIASP